jgi:hypothetical protein
LTGCLRRQSLGAVDARPDSEHVGSQLVARRSRVVRDLDDQIA